MPSWPDIQAELQTRPLREALPLIEEYRTATKARIREETILLEKLEEAYAGLRSLVKTEGDGPGEPYLNLSIDQKVVHTITQVGRPITFEELYKLLPEYTPTQVYNATGNPTRADSLVNKGIVIFDKTTRPGTIRLVPNTDQEDTLVNYIQEIVDLDPTVTKDDPLVIRVAEAIKTYTEQVVWPRNGGKRLRANHTWKALENRGVIGALSRIVLGQETKGFSGVIELGRRDLTAEAVILDFSDRFAPEVVNAAKKRLDDTPQ